MSANIRVGGARVDFTADDRRYQAAVNRVGRSNRRLGQSYDRLGRQAARQNRTLNAVTGRLRNIALATASVAGVFQGIRIGRSAIEQADNIGKVADALGFTVEGLQEYRFAAQQTGIEQRTFDLAAQRLTRRLGEAANGFGEARDALRFLNIDLRDSEGNIRSTEDVLGDVAEAFETNENPAERLRLAFKLFDSEGARLVNTLGRGREALDAYREQARDLGMSCWTEDVSQAR